MLQPSRFNQAKSLLTLAVLRTHSSTCCTHKCRPLTTFLIPISYSFLLFSQSDTPRRSVRKFYKIQSSVHTEKEPGRFWGRYVCPEALLEALVPEDRDMFLKTYLPGWLKTVALTAAFIALFGSSVQAQTESSADVQTVRVGLGYLPDVQFASFYAAHERGFYADEGLAVEFQHGFASELYPLLAQGKLDFVVGDAEDVISLRAQDPEQTPFVYVMALFQRVPNALFSLAEQEITTPADLAGKTVGIPGLFGSSYTAFQAVLRAADLGETDVTVEQIGFTQLEAVLSGRVDVALGFVNNEPLVLAAQGVAVNVIPVAPYNPSLGSGVITTDAVLGGDLTERFLRASQRGVAFTLADPKAAFNAAESFVENLDEARFAVLEATLPLWESPYSRANGVGFSNPARWLELLALLKETGRVETDLPAETFFSNAYLDPEIAAESAP